MLRLLSVLCCVARLSALQLSPGGRPTAAAASRVPLRLSSPLTALEVGAAMKGACKWFDSTKGFGFIAVEGEEQDVFVHQSDIYAPGFRSLAEGEELEFKVAADPKTGKLKAVEVTGPDGAYVQGAPRQDFDDGY